MDVVAAKITSYFESICDGDVCEILITERWQTSNTIYGHHLSRLTNDFALRNEQRELILASIGELAQLHASNFRTDVCCKVCDCCPFQKIRKARVSILAVLVMLEGLQRWIPLR